MIFSLRWPKQSVGLRILAVLAWSLLVSTSVNAAPGRMRMPVDHAVHVVASLEVGQAETMSAMGHGVHGTADRSCCGGHRSPGGDCYCAFGSTLPPLASFSTMSVSFATVYASPSLMPPPSPNPAPPWRPPSE